MEVFVEVFLEKVFVEEVFVGGVCRRCLWRKVWRKVL